MSSRSITVLGGGISGLSAAFHLSRRFPARSGTRITLVESSPRLGGWVRSEKVRVKDRAGHEADVVLESGPRTLRPISKAVLELNVVPCTTVHLLQLNSSVITVPRTAPAARNRFVHIPGQEGLVTIPGSFPSLIRPPLARIMAPAVLRDIRRRNNKVLNNSSPNDESVDAFFTRHFGPDFARTFGSALVHGIYATDSRVLSVRSAFPMICELEERGKGSLVRGAISEMLPGSHSRKGGRQGAVEVEAYELGGVPQLMKGISVFSFQDGMQTLTDAMAAWLAKCPHVEIVQGDGVAALSRLTRSEGYEVVTEAGKQFASSHLISAIPLSYLHQLLNQGYGDLAPLPHLTANPSSSVTVVNLVFPRTPDPIHPGGLGYLIPRPSSDYPSSSLGILGTVFDSCALPAQDKLISSSPSSSSRFTKLTVMLGGPYGAPAPAPSSPSFLPTLLETLCRHLGRAEPLPEPCLVRVREHKDCIPTPTVGHAARMAELANAVKERWDAKATVIGAGVGGVSVGDCVEGGRRAAFSVNL